jgi:hypothetical protein
MPLGEEKTSHAGIIRIGFEGISQPHTRVEHPCFSFLFKHRKRDFANAALGPVTCELAFIARSRYK